MIRQFAEVLGRDECQRLCQQLDTLPFRDGRETAGQQARREKRNFQADARDTTVAALRKDIERAVTHSPGFAAAALPRRFGPMVFNRYETGNFYGPHCDNAIMKSDSICRADLSFTLFLSTPDSYDGGELTLHLPGGAEQLKLPAGALVLYPATFLHSVEPVTSGTRFAAIGWVQSLVRHAEQREILFDLHRAQKSLERESQSDSLQLLARSYANLLRCWADP